MRDLFRTPLLLGLAAFSLTACDGGDPAGGNDTDGVAFRAEQVSTLLMGASDNAEVVKAIPGADSVLLVSSKARKVSRLAVSGESLDAVREISLFPDDATESELTHIDVSADGSWAVLTRTILRTDAAGAQTGCGGELVFVDVTDSDDFGTVLGQVEVGPMPDSVDISDDQTFVVSANERDGLDAWGKCEVPGAKASISVVDVAAGPASASESFRVEMIDAGTGPREPESVIVGPDNDLIVATLQDSHELALFRRSELEGIAAPTSDQVTILDLPLNGLGAGMWPDGVGSVVVGSDPYFIVAGEWNDTFAVVDATGGLVSAVELDPSDIPETFPRVVDEGSPLFSPDSVATFVRDDRAYVAFSLRHTGAIAVYEVTDPTAPTFVQVVPVGQDEQGGADEDGSTIRPEGIAAASDGRFLVTANEGESSVSLVLPIER